MSNDQEKPFSEMTEAEKAEAKRKAIEEAKRKAAEKKAAKEAGDSGEVEATGGQPQNEMTEEEKSEAKRKAVEEAKRKAAERKSAKEAEDSNAASEASGEDEKAKAKAAAVAKAKAAAAAKKKAAGGETSEASGEDEKAKAKAAAVAKAKAATAAKKKAASGETSEASGEDEKAKAKAAAVAKAKAAAAAKKKAAGGGATGSGDDEKSKAIAAAKAKAKAAAAAKSKTATGGPAANDSEAFEEKPSPNQPILDKYVKVIKDNLGEEILEDSYINRLGKDVPTLVAKRESYYKLAEFLRYNEQLYFEYLSELHGTDFETHMEIYSHLYSYKNQQSVALKVKVDRDQPEVASLTPLWAGANWPEREAYDLLGIRFTGHPNLTRILMSDDWVGHPMRKDYEPYDVEV
ncbi:NADH-quinone oxidoreductase subunit C [Pseudalkalibacillus decolorationis]|uniref:NADH-quinone oxidoreductase subunit C n=1 Tax=Pseudalkalibacillus decolorationis TaxID=163879 RepID=UPI002148C170|nr:NADH-quinone oxidoreductase subunit C [Pseudalkalibacillus decolorationis]